MKPSRRERVSDHSKVSLPFGHVLRAKRLEKRLGLRKFAELVGVSPTYLCRVEQCSVVPPTAHRVRRMAELLEENPDQWIALAGRSSEDLKAIITEAPAELSQLLRAVRGMTAKQLRTLVDAAERINQET